MVQSSTYFSHPAGAQECYTPKVHSYQWFLKGCKIIVELEEFLKNLSCAFWLGCDSYLDNLSPVDPLFIPFRMSDIPTPSLKRSASLYFPPAKRPAIFKPGSNIKSTMTPAKALVLKGLKIDFLPDASKEEGRVTGVRRSATALFPADII